MEFLLATFHGYFLKLPKKLMEFFKLAEIMETKRLKILKHYNMHWIEMLAPLKHVLSEYCILILKMAADYNSHLPSCTLFHLLCIVKTLLSTYVQQYVDLVVFNCSKTVTLRRALKSFSFL